MGIVVQKFGGSSVADAVCIKRVAQRVIEAKKDGNQVVVVVSAMGDTTDDLLALVKQINDNPNPRELDMLLTTGEQITISLLAMAIEAEGHKVISLTGPQAGIKTNEIYSKAKITDIDPTRVKLELNDDKIVVVAGFQGMNKFGDMTTLGRGGSDTTAVALAAGLNADCCEIFTDVDGVYTADPRIVPDASKLDYISYDEMLELASLGAVVLQPRAVEFAKNFNVPVVVRSSFNHNPGTLVKGESKMEKDRVISGVAHDLNVVKFGVFDVPDKPGIANKIFKSLADASVNIDMIIQATMRDGINNISFTCTHDDLNKAEQVVDQVVKEIGAGGYTHDENVAKVSIVGAGMVSNTGVAADMFEALAENDINIEMITTSEIKVSVIIRAEQVKLAVLALHNKFQLNKLGCCES